MIKINEVTLENINITNGRILYSYVNNYSAKNYSIHIIYGENGVYNKSEWEGTLTITSSPLQVVTNNINTNAGSTINIKAEILDNNKPANGLIKTAIKINNKTIIEQNITDGIIDVNYTLPDNIPAGENKLTIIAGDSRKYTHNITEVDLIVTKNYKYVNSTDINATTNATITVNAAILDINNSPLMSDTPVNIKIAGKSVATFNTSNGKIEYNYTLPSDMKKGRYDIIIQAGETNTHLHATESVVLTVE